MGSWVAECIIHRSDGKLIRQFRSQQHLMEKLSLHKAQLKMLLSFVENSTDRSTIKKYYSTLKRVERNLVKTAAKIDRLAFKLGNNRSTNTSSVSKTVEPVSDQAVVQKKSFCCSCTNSSEKYALGNNGKGDFESKESASKRRAVDGFIIFEYNESFARCIEDHSRFGHFPFSLCYPSQLKFKGRALKVSKAPEPEQINWENLEVLLYFSYYNYLS